MLSEAVDQRAALQQKVEELQKKLDEAKAKPAETPPP